MGILNKPPKKIHPNTKPIDGSKITQNAKPRTRKEAERQAKMLEKAWDDLFKDDNKK